MAALKLIPEMGSIAKCKKGYIGLIVEVENDVAYGFHLGRIRFGEPWQSIDPEVIGNIYEYLKVIRDK